MKGLYIHIPFCAKKCSYCDFHFSTSYNAYRDQMLAALKREVELRQATDSEKQLSTIYFGGGTPSLLTPSEVRDILQHIAAFYNVDASAEITLECNPDDCSTENLEGWKHAGINRLSIGLQSFTNEQLEWMNRTHTASEGVSAVKRAKEAGFRNISVDIMYGLPDLSADNWLQQLEMVTSLEVNHISAYCLTIEEKTPLAKWVKNGTIHPSDADQQSEQFELLLKELRANSYEQYEISNFARNGHYSKHNTSYWQGKQYLGIGPSAHGYNGTERYWNIPDNRQYMKAISAGELPETRELLSANDRFNELLLTGLRTKWGTDLSSLKTAITPDQNWYERLEHWKVTGNLIENNDHIFLTEQGKLLADAIAADLFIL